MDLEQVTQFIANVGFPALMCIIFVVAIKYILDTYCSKIDNQTDAINRQSKDIENIKEDMNELQQGMHIALENNTHAMNQLNETVQLLLKQQKGDDE